MFFSSYPTVNYGGVQARNIMLGVRILPEVMQRYTSYYVYTLVDGDSPTSIAYDYYGSVDYAWLVMLSAQVQDPYYDWPLELNSFNAYVAKKYGSVDASFSEIVGYQRSTPSGSINALTTAQLQQFDDLIDSKYGSQAAAENTILFYVSSLTSSRISPAEFSDLPSEQQSAYTAIDAYSFEQQNFISYINTENQKTSRILLSPFTYDTLDPAYKYGYGPVFAYQYETELNDLRRSIRLISRRYAHAIQLELREKLNNAAR